MLCSGNNDRGLESVCKAPGSAHLLEECPDRTSADVPESLTGFDLEARKG